MKKIVISLFIFFGFINITNAHPGNLDIFGGHTCYTNCSTYGLYTGQYHYHITYNTGTDYNTFYTPGVCPENFKEKSYLDLVSKYNELQDKKRTLYDDLKKKNRLFPTSIFNSLYNQELYKLNNELYDLEGKMKPLSKEYFACENKKIEDKNKIREQIQVHFDNAGEYINKKEYLLAIEELEKVKELRKELKDELESINDLIGDVYFSLGSTSLYKNNYSESLEYFLKTLSLYTDKEKLGNSYNNIGLIYSFLGDLDKSLINFKVAKYKYLAVGNKEKAKSVDDIMKTVQNKIADNRKNRLENLKRIQEEREKEKKTKNLELKKNKYKEDFKKILGNKLDKLSVKTLDKILLKVKNLKKPNINSILKLKLEALEELLNEAKAKKIGLYDWDAFVYPNGTLVKSTYKIKKGFASLNECRDWSKSNLGNDLNADYECGYKCRETSYGINVCEKTVK